MNEKTTCSINKDVGMTVPKTKETNVQQDGDDGIQQS